MTISLHQRAKDIFTAALDCPVDARAAFLADACGSDQDLRAEVESLLSFHDGGDSAVSGIRPTFERRFAPGEIFANRYRMVTRIGRGGMGDVWQADDLVLETPVALKFIDSATPEGRAVIFNEVRLARQITHPAVCRVFDVSESGGDVFFSMELIRGEDLASLLRRVGRLPSERVVDVARQLCAGLAAAHAQGVLHRDLKPANILVDEKGLVRITDFGIAVAAAGTGRHEPIGTPGYMAPEQLAPGGRLSERTDLYALGLVLYELLVGHHAFSTTKTASQPPRPSALVPDVDRQLERAILQALSVDPAERPASAAAISDSLPAAAGTARTRGRSRWLIGASAAALAAAAILAATIVMTRGPRGLTEQDVIVIADFENTTGDAVFDGTLKVALAVALEQSPFLKVFPDERVQETLRLMNRRGGERITRPLAREIAEREQLKALVAGSIGRLGANYVVAVEAVNARTGDVMARQQVEVDAKERVLTDLGRAASKLRERLGESLASVQRFDVSLPRATTPSLEALHAYALALDEGRLNPRLEAIPHLKRAIELDPDFALALAQLSGVYVNTNQTALAPEFSRRAFALRDRVSERERFFISWRYYRDAAQAWDKALDLARLWTQTYPREPFAFNSFGIALINFGEYEQAIEPFRQALRLDSKFGPLYSNLGGAFMALNRFEDAKAILQDGAARGIDFAGMHRIGYHIAFIEGDTAAMARHVQSSIGLRRTNVAYGWEAHVHAFGGRVMAAHEQFRRGIGMALQGGFKEVAAQLSVEDAERHAIAGQCSTASKELADGLLVSRDNFSLETAARVHAICGAEAEAASISAELARRFPEATITNRLSVPLAAAALAIHRGEWARALHLLEPVRPYDDMPFSGFWPQYLRGQAHLGLKDARSARADFESILDHRGKAPLSELYPLAHLGRARAAALAGDAAAARESYGTFLALWSGADPTLPHPKEARLELDRLH